MPKRTKQKRDWDRNESPFWIKVKALDGLFGSNAFIKFMEATKKPIALRVARKETKLVST